MKKNSKSSKIDSDAKRIGGQAGKKTGQMTRKAVETARLTAKDAVDFTNAFIENFKKELKKHED